MRRPFLKQLTAAAVAALMAFCPFTGSTAIAANVRETIPAVVTAPSGGTATIEDAVFDLAKDDYVTVGIKISSAEPVAGIDIQLFADGKELPESSFPISLIYTDPEMCFDYVQGNRANGMFSAICDVTTPSKSLTVYYKLKPKESVKPGRYELTATVTATSGPNAEIPVTVNAGTLTVKDSSADGTTVVTVQDAIFDMTQDETVTIPVRFKSGKPIFGLDVKLLANGQELSACEIPATAIKTDPDIVFDYGQANVKTGEYEGIVDGSKPSDSFKVLYTLKPTASVMPGKYQLTAVVTAKGRETDLPVIVNAGTLTVLGNKENGTAQLTVSDAEIDLSKDKEFKVTVDVKADEKLSGTQMQLLVDHKFIDNDALTVKSIEIVEDPFADTRDNPETAQILASTNPPDTVAGNLQIVYTIAVNDGLKPGTYTLSTQSLFVNKDNYKLHLTEEVGTLRVTGVSGTANVTISDATLQNVSGSTAKITVKVTSDSPIERMTMRLYYNEADTFPSKHFNIDKIEISEGFDTVSSSLSNSTVNASCTSADNAKKTAEIVYTLSPDALLKAGTYPVSVALVCYDFDGNKKAVTQTPGTLTVPASVVTPTDATDADPTDTTDTTDPSDTTDATDSTKSPIKPSRRILGDMDGDKKLGIVDVIVLNKNLMVGEPLSDEAKENADVDQNGKIDETDALNILKAVVEIITLPMVD